LSLKAVRGVLARFSMLDCNNYLTGLRRLNDYVVRSFSSPRSSRCHDGCDPGVQGQDSLGGAPGHDAHLDYSGRVLGH